MTMLAQAVSFNQIWYVLPLIVSVSLVYGATRHELMGAILSNAFRAATWIVGFMGIIFGILVVVSWML